METTEWFDTVLIGSKIENCLFLFGQIFIDSLFFALEKWTDVAWAWARERVVTLIVIDDVVADDDDDGDYDVFVFSFINFRNESIESNSIAPRFFSSFLSFCFPYFEFTCLSFDFFFFFYSFFMHFVQWKLLVELNGFFLLSSFWCFFGLSLCLLPHACMHMCVCFVFVLLWLLLMWLKWQE